MTDTKIRDLTGASALALADITEVTVTPGGTPASRKATIQQVADAIVALPASNTGVDKADLVPHADVSASNVAKTATVQNFIKGAVNSLSLTTAAKDDVLLLLDTSNSSTPIKATLDSAIGHAAADNETTTLPGDPTVAMVDGGSTLISMTVSDMLKDIDNFSAFSGTIDGAADKLVFFDDSAGTVHYITPNKLAAGLWTIAVPANALSPRSANGCAAIATTNGASGQPDVPYLAFDGAAAEYARFGPFRFPKGWNAGTITASVTWRRASGTGAANVVWGIRALSIGDDESPAQNFGTGATVTDAASTTTVNFMTTAATSACTIAGSPAKGDMIFIEVYRDGASGSDTLDAVDAWLSGIQIYYSTDARDDT